MHSGHAMAKCSTFAKFGSNGDYSNCSRNTNFQRVKNDGYNRMSSEVLVKCANKNKLSLWSKQLLLQGHLYCRHDIAIGFLLGHATHF